MKQSFERKLTQLTAKFIRCISKFWLDYDPQETHLIPKGPMLVVARHTSYLDGILLGAYFLKFQTLSPLATAGLFRFPTDIILRGANAIPVRRGQPFHLQTIKMALKRLQSGSVLIFPEGGVRIPYSKSPLKAGFVLLALKSGVPIIFCHLENASVALPPGRLFVRRKKVSFKILKVIQSGDYGYPLCAGSAEREQCLQIAINEYGF